MAPSLCWDFKLSNEGSFVEIGQEMTKLGWKVWQKSLQSLRAELQSLRAESIAVCMQRWSFRRRSLSWETSFDWSEMKVRALPGVSPHPAVRTWPGFQIKLTQPDFSWFFMRTIPAAENRGALFFPNHTPNLTLLKYRNPNLDPDPKTKKVPKVTSEFFSSVELRAEITFISNIVSPMGVRRRLEALTDNSSKFQDHRKHYR